MALIAVLVALLSVSFTDAAIGNSMLRAEPRIPELPTPEGMTVTSPNGTGLPPLDTVYYFDQLIDHDDPGLGTFQQRYWTSQQFYKPGGPIILMTPGETNAEHYTGFLTNKTINGMIAQQQHGATIVLEHRFFGQSNPYDNLTSQSLELLTIQQAIDDLAYFAQNVNLPMPGGDNVKPDNTPWIIIGGSYSGALVSWTMVSQPGVFYAGYSSSGVVEAITDYYGYFTPILEHMPQNCSSDIQAVVAHLDEIYAKNDTTAVQSLKDAFGLGNLSHIDDFAAALQYNLFGWQSLQPDSGPGGLFFEFCDALEVKDGGNAPPTGWGLDHAISAWGSYWKNTYYALVCGTVDAETCLGTYDANQTFWTNVTVDNDFRSWSWVVCNQLGYYQNGPPLGQPAIVSRIIQSVYFERQCVNMFPQKFSSPPTPDTAGVNEEYKGWDVNVPRLFFANGDRDPWRGATVSAEGLYKESTDTQPIYLSDGFHASDLVAKSGVVDETVRAVQEAGLQYMKEWLAQWECKGSS